MTLGREVHVTGWTTKCDIFDNLDFEKEMYSPFCLVDLLNKVKHEKTNWKNFTNHAQAIGYATVLFRVFLNWAKNKRIGQCSQENNVQRCLKAAKKWRTNDYLYWRQRKAVFSVKKNSEPFGMPTMHGSCPNNQSLNQLNHSGNLDKVLENSADLCQIIWTWHLCARAQPN